jgi:hypothetical protein
LAQLRTFARAAYRHLSNREQCPPLPNALNILLARRVHWWEPDSFREWGDLALHVSVFDHRLTEDEAADSPIMGYQLSRREGAMPAYIAGERRWEAFYRELASAGARMMDERRHRIVTIDGSSGRLARLVRASLREQRLMDVIFDRWPVRVLGGHDRTDLLLPATAQEREAISALAMQHGLHVLPSA